MSAWIKQSKQLMPLLLLALVAGCSQKVAVSALFTAETQVGAGNRVWFDQEIIGEVERTSREDNGTRVFLSLHPEKSKTLRAGAAALLVDRAGATGVEIFNVSRNREPLSSGAELVGLNSAVEYVVWQSREALDSTQETLSEFTSFMQNYLDSDEWKSQKKEFEQSLHRFGTDLRSAMEEVEQEYGTLAEELKTLSEQNSEEVQRQLKEITAALEQQVQDLLDSGEAAAAGSLQQFLDMLEQLIKRRADLREPQKTSATPT